jgi:hypothetical protein
VESGLTERNHSTWTATASIAFGAPSPTVKGSMSLAERFDPEQWFRIVSG